MSANKKDENTILECGKYYDAIDDFEREVKKLNDAAANGRPILFLKREFSMLVPAFTYLCGGDLAMKQKKRGRKKKTEEKQ